MPPSPARKLRRASGCSLTFATHESRKAPASSPAAGTPMCSGRTTTAAGRRNKSFTPSTARATPARPSPLSGVTLHDWEDLAIDGAGHLYIGDIGNNDSKRDALAVYEIDEPNPQASAERISPKRVWNLRFPGAPFDCESLFVWKDDGYVVSKLFNNARAQIFRFPLKETNRAADARTGCDDENRIASHGRGYICRRDTAWTRGQERGLRLSHRRRRARVNNANPHHTKLKNQHIEGCCFVPEGLLVTSERRMIFLFTDPAFRRQ